MFLKLLLVLEFYMIVSVCFLFLVSLLKIDFDIQRASQLKLLFRFIRPFYLHIFFLFLVFFLRVDFHLSSCSLTFELFFRNFSEKLNLSLQLKSTSQLKLCHGNGSRSMLVLNDRTEFRDRPFVQCLIINKEFESS